MNRQITEIGGIDKGGDGDYEREMSTQSGEVHPQLWLYQEKKINSRWQKREKWLGRKFDSKKSEGLKEPI